MVGNLVLLCISIMTTLRVGFEIDIVGIMLRISLIQVRLACDISQRYLHLYSALQWHCVIAGNAHTHHKCKSMIAVGILPITLITVSFVDKTFQHYLYW